MSTSYQNLDVRVVGLENALRFLMESFSVAIPGEVPRTISMYDYYREQLVKGLLIPDGATSGTDSDSVVLA